MRAAVIERTGPGYVVSAREWPERPPGPGEVTVAVRCAALNRNDVMTAADPSVPAPVVIGSDGGGVVRDVGAGVQGIRAGDEVVLLPSVHWGPDERVPGPAFEILGWPTQGTHAQQIVIPAANVFPRPRRLDWRECAALPLAGLTAWRALTTRGSVRAGQTVLVTGAAGGVGTFLAQVAVALGARVIATTSGEAKMARVSGLGVAGVVDRRLPDWPQKVRALAPGGVDLACDSSGADWDAVLSTLRPGGTLVVFGRTVERQTRVDVGRLFLGQHTIHGTTMGSPREFQALLQHVEGASWRPVVDSVHPLDRCQDAYACMDDPDRFGKVVIEMPS